MSFHVNLGEGRSNSKAWQCMAMLTLRKQASGTSPKKVQASAAATVVGRNAS